MTAFPLEVLFAKHRLLPEIGPEGQRALSASTCELPSEMGQFACDAARGYLVRSGVGVAPSDVRRAREEASEGCLAELEGALLALAHVQRVVGVGAPLTISDALREGTKKQ